MAYSKLPTPIPKETRQDVQHCDNNNLVSMRMKELDEKLGPEYLELAGPSIALAKAAARLAMPLNQIWPWLSVSAGHSEISNL